MDEALALAEPLEAWLPALSEVDGSRRPAPLGSLGDVSQHVIRFSSLYVQEAGAASVFLIASTLSKRRRGPRAASSLAAGHATLALHLPG